MIEDNSSYLLETVISEHNINLPKIELNPDDVQAGLGKLVLILLNLIHELLERQALRRIESGDLTEDQIEKLGMTLQQQTEEIKRICKILNLSMGDLNLDLGPLGKLF